MDTLPNPLSPELISATETLAETLLCSEPIAVYYQAKTRLEADPTAGALLKKYSAAQAELRQQQQNGGVTQVSIDRLRAMQREVQANRLIMDFADAQQAAMKYLPEVNQVISQLLGVDFASLAGPASC